MPCGRAGPGTLADNVMAAFAPFNGARLRACMPQIIYVHRDPNGAVTVSLRH